MFLSRNLLRVAVTAAPRRFFSIDATQHPLTASREASARVLKLAEVCFCPRFNRTFVSFAHCLLTW
jgi:hypothetical protein